MQKNILTSFTLQTRSLKENLLMLGFSKHCSKCTIILLSLGTKNTFFSWLVNNMKLWSRNNNDNIMNSPAMVKTKSRFLLWTKDKTRQFFNDSNFNNIAPVHSFNTNNSFNFLPLRLHYWLQEKISYYIDKEKRKLHEIQAWPLLP